ncbi:MAG TPA: rod shape-determining protein MreC [Trebonia sp.]
MHGARRTRSVLIALLIVAIALITLDFRASGSSPAHGIGAGVFGPMERVAGNAASPLVGLFHAATGSNSSEIATLQRQNDQLRAELITSQLSKDEQAQLTRLLQIGGKGGYRIVAASVIAAGGEYADTVTIDVGRRDGIAVNETVLNGDGLVGVVSQVGSGTATVLLASAASATVGVRLAGTNEIGALTGTSRTMAGSGDLQLKLLSATAVLHRGQALVTFGSVGGRPYVPGVPVGEVAAVNSQPGSLTQTGAVRPFVDFSGLGVVGVVIAPPRVDPHDSVLPPKLLPASPRPTSPRPTSPRK